MLLSGLAMTVALGCVGRNDANDQGSSTPPVVATVTVSRDGGPGLAESIWLYGVPIARPTEYATIVPFSDGQHVRLQRDPAPLATVPTSDREADANIGGSGSGTADLPVDSSALERSAGGLDWRSLIQQYDDWSVGAVLLVIYGPTAVCPNGESSGNPRAFNAGNYGGLQINYASHRDKLIAVAGSDDPALLYVPWINVAVAHLVYQAAGNTFSPWSCAP